MVNSVIKGYEMIKLLLASLPGPLYSFFIAGLAILSLAGMVYLVVKFFGGS